MGRTCGIDWGEEHHEVAVLDEAGKLVGRARIRDNAQGFRELLDVLTEAGDGADALIPVAVETSRGLLVAARYRDRHSAAWAKSDHADAVTLANILRTDAAAHRTLPQDTELAKAIAVLARAQQDAVWLRNLAANRLRSLLCEFFPAVLEVFQVKDIGLVSREARAVLAVATTPSAAARLTRAQLTAALRRSGRWRNIEVWVERLRTVFRAERLSHPPLVEQAFGRQAAALLAQLDAACRAADDLAEACSEAFATHRDAQIITSFPGLGPLTGARVLAEIGDDRARFQDARSLKAYAGSAPVTRASGKTSRVTFRRIKNQRLAAVGHVWAFAAISTQGPREHYDRRCGRSDRHTAALRHLFNRMLGQLHHCLETGQDYDRTAAFPLV